MNFFGLTLTKKPLVKILEEVELFDFQNNKVKILVKVDTGADRTSIDKDLAEKLNLYHPKKIVGDVIMRGALGRHRREIIRIAFLLKGNKIESDASVIDRSHMNFKMIIGKRDLQNFLVDPS